jgi:hypothetical protein
LKVKVPPNAFLAPSGYDWKCKRGFREVGTRCLPIDVPANAHLDGSGNDWDCNSGYVERKNACTLRQAVH